MPLGCPQSLPQCHLRAARQGLAAQQPRHTQRAEILSTNLPCKLGLTNLLLCAEQVAEDSGLGFDLIRDTFISYQDLAEDEKPSTDDEKLQTWVRQQCKVAKLNLAPYFKAWGWPVSEDTEAACSEYSTYNPPSSSN